MMIAKNELVSQDGGRLKKDIKLSEIFCSYCNLIVLIGSQKSSKYFNFLFCNKLLFLDLGFAILSTKTFPRRLFSVNTYFSTCLVALNVSMHFIQ